jgi:beta-lactam-binding protein with PASTA domain
VKVTKILVVAAAAFAAIAATAILISNGRARATPVVSGRTFSEAQAALREAGYTAVASTSVGDQLPQSDCIVVRLQSSSDSRVLLSLRCYQPADSSESP